MSVTDPEAASKMRVQQADFQIVRTLTSFESSDTDSRQSILHWREIICMHILNNGEWAFENY